MKALDPERAPQLGYPSASTTSQHSAFPGSRQVLKKRRHSCGTLAGTKSFLRGKSRVVQRANRFSAQQSIPNINFFISDRSYNDFFMPIPEYFGPTVRQYLRTFARTNNGTFPPVVGSRFRRVQWNQNTEFLFNFTAVVNPMLP